MFEGANNPDQAGCAALRGGSDDGTFDFRERLGGEAAGVVAGDCPVGCADPRQLPRSMRPSRQRDLTILSVLPFFEAMLRDDRAARDYLENTLAPENADTAVQLQP